MREVWDADYVSNLPEIDPYCKNAGVVMLCRGKDPCFSSLRNDAESWFAQLPETAKPDIRQRLRSDDDGQFDGALWEVFVHHWLKEHCHFASVENHREVGKGRPDWHANGAPLVDQLIVECYAPTPPKVTVAEDRFFEELQRQCMHALPKGWLLSVAARSEPGDKSDAEQIVRSIHAWLDSVPEPGDRNEFWSGDHCISVSIIATTDEAKELPSGIACGSPSVAPWARRRTRARLSTKW